MLTPHDYTPKPLPNLESLTVAELVMRMKGAGSAGLLHLQQELLRRDIADVTPLLIALIHDSNADIASRVAAIYTYKQAIGVKANAEIGKLAFSKGPLQAAALRALTDRLGELPDVDAQRWTELLKQDDPRVMAQALISIKRLADGGKLSTPELRKELSRAILPLSVIRDAEGQERKVKVSHDQGDEPRVIPVLATESQISLADFATLTEASEVRCSRAYCERCVSCTARKRLI